jgi:hypothetical protein
MKLNYNVTGQERKTLVGAISQELNAPTKYLGVPTFTYEVGGYHIDRNGTVTGKDNLDLEDALHRMGFDAIEREYDESDTYESGLGGMGALPSPEELEAEAIVYAEREIRRQRLEDEHVPDYSNRGQYGGDVIPAFEDLRLTEEEELGLGRRHREDFQGENGIQADDVPEPDELVIEMPLTGFTPEKLDNLSKLVAAKASLLKAALGVEDLPIQQTENTLRFPWFTFNPENSEEVKAYIHLVAALCDMAKTQQRVNASEKPVDNEKYAFRCFLLRLGFIGAEYKAERKILLSKLTGSSAFKNPTTGGTDNE